jgi:hypothetical protein
MKLFLPVVPVVFDPAFRGIPRCGENRIVVLHQLSAKTGEMSTDGKMPYSFTECKKRFGSPYKIDKAVAGRPPYRSRQDACGALDGKRSLW